MKFAKATCVVRWEGGTTALRKGMSVDDDHPLVVARPEFFEDEPANPQLRTPRVSRGEPAVERATRAPGEARKAVGRGRQARADKDADE